MATSSTLAFATPATTASTAPCELVQRETIRSQLIKSTKFSWSCVRYGSLRDLFNLLVFITTGCAYIYTDMVLIILKDGEFIDR